MARTAFFSLKWKLLLPLSLAMGIGIGALTWINDRSLRREAENTRADSASRNLALLRFLVGQNERQLLDAGAALGDFLVASQREGGLGLDAGFIVQPYWEQISLGRGFESLRLYDANRHLLTGFGAVPVSGRLLDARLAEVLAGERPVSGLDCAPRCEFHGITPILHDGATAGAVMMTMDLSGLLSAFGQSSGHDVAVVADAASAPRQVAVTAAGLDALAILARFAGHERKAASTTLLSREGGRVYAWQVLRPLDATAAPVFVTRQDATNAERAINQAFMLNLATGLGVFLLAEGALLLSLGWFMRRMNRVSTGLPLLGAGRWRDARQHLKLRELTLRDELSTLETAAHALAGQLETLDTASRNQQHDLAQLVDSLSHERDVVSGLLNTAQALILTQDERGVIRMANHYTGTLTGLDESRLIGRDFFELLLSEQDRHEARTRMLGYFAGGGAPLRFEATLNSAGGPHNIAWVHSIIGQEGGETLVLSVGLDLTELKDAQARASYLSDYDTLTGLYNRQGFQRRLEQALAEAGGGALLLVDLDDFKAINDLAGHNAGDTVIRHMAERLSELKPAPRIAARLGGDEFALYFEPLPDAQLLQTARLLCKGDQTRHLVTACVGIALAPVGGSLETLFSHADLALSQARAKGRSNWHLYNAKDGIRESLLNRTEQLALITDALNNDRLMLYMQPIVSLQSGRTTHHEVLLRVRTPDGRILAPAPLIAAAEASGLIRDIDLWVLQQAVALIAGRPELRLAVNLSARSLDNAELPAVLDSLLQTYQVNAQQLTLEITETAALAQIGHAETVLGGIHSLGCKLALDDFGVGFSTFQYLKHLPVDFVKIDGSFIRTLDHSDDDRLFVKALVEAIHGYGKLAVAEYVENEAILGWVTELGVDYGQGYHFARPQPQEMVLKTV